MNKTKTYYLTQPVIENIAYILGDTANGFTGSEIHKFLLLANIEDIDCNNTKRYRLYNAFIQSYNNNKCANNILRFIQVSLAPERFVNNKERFERLHQLVNQQLAFCGFMLNENGKFCEVKRASSISDVEIKAKNLKQELEKRNCHQELMKYCKSELLLNNYFHAVFEANKGLLERIRQLSGSTEDGYKLIERVFSSNPVLIINNYQTQSEKDEHYGFCNLLKGLCSMFRNTGAHEPKILWDINEQDALDILGIISYCHRRLDKSQQIRIL